MANKIANTFNLVLVLLLALSSKAQADSPTAKPDGPTPTVEKFFGKPIVFKWDGQHEAVLKVSTMDSPLLHMPAKVSESLCSSNQGMICGFDFIARQKFYFLAWTKNPDSSKIGDRVRVHFADRSPLSKDIPLEATQILLGTEIYAPKLRSGLPFPILSCTDYSWLPSATPKAPTEVHVVEWDAEYMLRNPETYVNENRIFSGAMNVDLKQNSSGSLTVSNVGYLTGIGLGSLGIGIGDVINLSIQQADGDICQASLTPNMGALQSSFDEFQKNRPDPRKEQTIYKNGDDEAFDAKLLLGVSRDYERWLHYRVEALR
jgi:hypothetical protein